MYSLRLNLENMDFSAGHLLTYGDECEPLHGHNYQVGVELKGELNNDGFVVDIRIVKMILREICAKFNQKVLIPTQNSQFTIESREENVIIYTSVRIFALMGRERSGLEKMAVRNRRSQILTVLSSLALANFSVLGLHLTFVTEAVWPRIVNKIMRLPTDQIRIILSALPIAIIVLSGLQVIDSNQWCGSEN